jgi:hypothetical protein
VTKPSRIHSPLSAVFLHCEPLSVSGHITFHDLLPRQLNVARTQLRLSLASVQRRV